MSIYLRVILLMVSFFTFIYVFRKIRKEQLKQEDAIFWLLLSIVLVVLSLCPQIAYWASAIMGFMAPVNFIFLVVIFILLIKVFSQSLKLSKLETKFETLVELIAIKEKEAKDSK
ncbi:MAG: DUF2304 domain-containing protein [Lachnospiraceae bacterium]|nr:DUF2304 domain-containing protein [Lachnospiraceae bacterium]